MLALPPHLRLTPLAGATLVHPHDTPPADRDLADRPDPESLRDRAARRHRLAGDARWHLSARSVGRGNVGGAARVAGVAPRCGSCSGRSGRPGCLVPADELPQRSLGRGRELRSPPHQHAVVDRHRIGRGRRRARRPQPPHAGPRRRRCDRGDGVVALLQFRLGWEPVDLLGKIPLLRANSDFGGSSSRSSFRRPSVPPAIRSNTASSCRRDWPSRFTCSSTIPIGHAGAAGFRSA